MTIDKIDEAIKEEQTLYDIAKDKYEKLGIKNCLKRMEEHKQYIEWFEESKSYREIGTVEECKNSVLNIPKAYNKAIDDFVNACKEDILCQTFGLHIKGIERIAEQLKAGGENEN